MPKLTEDEINSIVERIRQLPGVMGTPENSIHISPNDNETERSWVNFNSNDNSRDYSNAADFEAYIRTGRHVSVRLIPVGNQNFIVSNDLLRRVFCE